MAALVAAAGLANLADGIARVGLPLLAAQMTGNATAVGGLIACFSLPWIVAALHVGVLVDRVDRRHLLLAAQTARSIAVTLLLAAFWFGVATIEWLFPVAVVIGSAEVLAMTSETAIVPMTVTPAKVQKTNAWITGLETLGSETIGPAVGGLLVAISPEAMLLAAAGGFSLALAGTNLITGYFVARNRADSGSAVQDAKAGVKYLLARPDLVYMTVLVGGVAACWSAWRTLIVLFAVEPGPMHLSSESYGILIAMLGIGGVVGALVANSITTVVGQKTAMFTNMVGTTAMVGVPLLTTSWVAVGAAIFLAGFGSSVWSINSRTIVQRTVPADMLGRFYAIYRMLSWGCLPAGAMFAGVAAESMQLRLVFAGVAALSVLQAVVFWKKFQPA